MRWVWPRVTPAARVWLLTAGLAAITIALYFASIRDLQPLDSGLRLPWWSLAGMFFATEVFVVHLQFKSDAHSFSLSEIALVIGLFFTSPSGLVAAQLVGGAAALIVHRRQSPLKAAFNIGHFCLEVSLASLIFHTVAPETGSLGGRGWLAAFVAAGVTNIVGVLAIFGAISLSQGKAALDKFRQVLGLGMAVTLTNTSLALIGVEILWHEPAAAWLLIVPIGTLFVAYRAYTSHRQRHESLELLYETTQALQQSLQIDSTLLTLASSARAMLRAEIAEITLLPEGQSSRCAHRTTLGPADLSEVMVPVTLDPLEGVWARVLSEGEGILLTQPITNARLREHFAERGIRDAVVVPLRDDTGILGTLLVANHLGEVSTFDDEDLKLLQTVANHASIALQNARLVARLEASLADLTETNRIKDDFVASVSHELRTPLTSIQGYAKTLLRDDVDFMPEQQRLFLRTIDRQSERLRNLIEDLLVVSRLESREEEPQLRMMSLKEVAAQVVDELRTRSEGRVVELDFDRRLPLVHADHGKVHQILLNLADNALKYTPDESHVRLVARTEYDSVVVSVEDAGPGIPSDESDKIFERFYQVDQSSTRTVGGAGLGLYICRKLAESMGAVVWLDRSDDSGSVFCLRLPLDDEVTNGHANGATPHAVVIEDVEV